jgi:hypothetical protein
VTALLISPVWIGWLATAHPKVVIDNRALLVVNWFIKYSIPWPAVERLDSDGDVTVVLRDGERIKVATGAASLASAIAGNRLQQEIATRVENALIQSSEDSAGAVMRSLDLHLGKFVIWQVGLLVIGWIGIR